MRLAGRPSSRPYRDIPTDRFQLLRFPLWAAISACGQSRPAFSSELHLVLVLGARESRPRTPAQCARGASASLEAAVDRRPLLGLLPASVRLPVHARRLSTIPRPVDHPAHPKQVLSVSTPPTDPVIPSSSPLVHEQPVQITPLPLLREQPVAQRAALACLSEPGRHKRMSAPSKRPDCTAESLVCPSQSGPLELLSV